MRRKAIYTLFALLIFVYRGATQSSNIDSLMMALKGDADDTNKVRKQNYISWELKNKGEYDKALRYAATALKLSSKLNYTYGLHLAYNNLGLLYSYTGNYPMSLQCHLRALTLAEQLQSPALCANVLSNIGNLYYQEENYTSSLEYQKRALRLRQGLLGKKASRRDTVALANSLGNIGIVYNDLHSIDTALHYHQQSLQLMKACGSIMGIANETNNIGSCYLELNEPQKALEAYSEALTLYMESDNRSGLGTTWGNLSDTYLTLKDHKKAEEFALKALKITSDIGDMDGIKESNGYLWRVYEETGRYGLALKYYKDFITIKDSLQNEENTKKNVRAEMQYGFDRREAAAKALQEKKNAVAAADRKKQSLILKLVSVFLILAAFFAFYAYRSLLQKKRANVEIIRQKELIEVKQKEILDSIYYARRIQRALLPNETYIRRIMKSLKNTGYLK